MEGTPLCDDEAPTDKCRVGDDVGVGNVGCGGKDINPAATKARRIGDDRAVGEVEGATVGVDIAAVADLGTVGAKLPACDGEWACVVRDSAAKPGDVGDKIGSGDREGTTTCVVNCAAGVAGG